MFGNFVCRMARRILIIALTVVAAESTAFAATYQVKVKANCPAGANTCQGETDVIPAGHTITVRHVSCEILTAPNPQGLTPLFMERLTKTNTIRETDFFIPVLAGSSAVQSNYAVNSPTLFTVGPGFKIGIEQIATATGSVRFLQCLLSGDDN